MSGSDISSKVDEMNARTAEWKNNVNQKIQERTQKLNESIDKVRAQLQSYGTQIQDYLNNMQADVEDYRFTVEKKGEGLSIDVAFKATIKGKEGTSSLGTEVR